MAVLTPQPKMQFTTAAGVPLSGGKVYTYVAGTTTPQATFTDYTGATPNTNPVILNSRGEANIWLGGALYKFRLTDANDVEIWTVDYISAPTSAVSPILSGNVTIDSDTPTPALKITQTGTGPVLRVQDSADPDATPFIIDNAGNVGIGTANPSAALDVSGNVAVSGSVTAGSVSAASFVGFTGIIAYFPATTAPSGWLKADGALVSRTTYANLWAFAQVSGNLVSDATWTGGNNRGAFSTGDGSTTFRVPDLRGEFLRGWDDGRGVDSGRGIGSWQAAEFSSHTHTGTTAGAGAHSHNTNGLMATGGSGAVAVWSTGIRTDCGSTTDVQGFHDHTFTTNASGGAETRPRNTALLACIKI